MSQTIADLLVLLLYLLMVAVVVRAVLSFFPLRPGNEFARLLYRLTEPMMEPVRWIMPRTGMFDFSGLVVIILLQVMITVVRRALT